MARISIKILHGKVCWDNIVEDPIKIARQMATSTLLHNKQKLPGININIHLADNNYIQQCNLEYRGKNQPTDVIALAYYDLRAGDEVIPYSCLGEIIISVDFIQEAKQNPEHYFRHLVVHGVLHLLGYDHELSEQEAEIMENIESEILAIYGVPSPYDA
jgi:probable rRNA maturation factor